MAAGEILAGAHEDPAGQVQRARIHSGSHWTLPASAWAGRRRPRGARLWAQFRAHSLPSGTFTGDRGHPVRAGHEHRRTVVNGGAQYSKACEGATLRGFNPTSTAADLQEHRCWRPVAGASGSPGLILAGSVRNPKRPHRQAQPRMSCLVTGIADDPEHKHARRRACALPFRAGRDRPRPAGYPPTYRPHRTELLRSSGERAPSRLYELAGGRRRWPPARRSSSYARSPEVGTETCLFCTRGVGG